MLITRDFAFVHLVKTGGVFIRELCLEHMADRVVSFEKGHLPISAMPEQYRDLPVFGAVRNPWDWYVSLYHYMRAHPEQWNAASERLCRTSFDEAVRACCADRAARERNADLYTRGYRAMFQPDLYDVEIGRFENLRQDFLAFIDRNAIAVPDELKAAIRERPPANVTSHRPYRTYYDDELQELVRRNCPLVEEFGYEF